MWETCMTLNYAPGWGYLHHSVADKSFGEVMFNLLLAVRLGGNFLFNVGPDARGHIAAPQQAILDRLGAWMSRHAEAVHDTMPTGIYREPNQGPNFHYGMFTCRGRTAYLTLFYYPGHHVILSRIGPAIRSATLLTTGQPLTVEPLRNARWKVAGLPATPPEPSPPVIRLEFDSAPYQLAYAGAGWLDGTLVEHR
jgi:alpha-L-fucosidase